MSFDFATLAYPPQSPTLGGTRLSFDEWSHNDAEIDNSHIQINAPDQVRWVSECNAVTMFGRKRLWKKQLFQ